MKKIHRFLLILILLLVGLNFSPVFAEDVPQPSVVNIYFFWGEGCPHCANEKPFLESLAVKYPTVLFHQYEVYYSPENQALFREFTAALGDEPRAVPTTIIGSRIWVGFRPEYQAEIEAAVQACMSNPCEFDPASVVSTPPELETPPTASESVITLPLIGTLDLSRQSLLVSTALIGFVDGFNPCSLWVLSVLLAITLHSGSRRKILVVGFTFLLTTTIVYSLFITGVFTILSYVGYLKWIQLLVALFALIFGLVNLKDYFWYKEGVSFSISGKHKPKMYQNMRSAVITPRSIIGLVSSTAILAVGVSLVEFACTAGFPVIWSNLVSSADVSAATFILLLAVYMLIYLLDELAVFGAAAVTMRASRLEEKHGRLLKLISGMVILALGAVMLVDPGLMNRLNTSLLVFALALSGAWLVYILHQRILPRFGVYIGTGLKKPARR